MDGDLSNDLPRKTLQLIALGVLIASSLWIVSPFIPALTWAVTIVVATWPLLLRVEALFGGRRGFAVATMTIALLLVLIVPLFFIVDAIAGNRDTIADWGRSVATMSVPAPPAWIESLPFVGTRLVARWQQAASMRPEEFAAYLVPYAQTLGVWLLRGIGSVGMLLVHFVLTVVISALLYANGESAADGAHRFARRLAGDQGSNAVQLAGQAIRGVALGVVVTALVQTTLVGIGLAVAGVPFVPVLVGMTFVLCVAQIGPFLVLVPSLFWVYSKSGVVWGVVFLVWSLLCGLMDNVVRPVLIRSSADLPLVLIFSGVIGGLFALGVIGLFIGPVVLAVAYTLLVNWTWAGEVEPPAA